MFWEGWLQKKLCRCGVWCSIGGLETYQKKGGCSSQECDQKSDQWLQKCRFIWDMVIVFRIWKLSTHVFTIIGQKSGKNDITSKFKNTL